MAHLISTRVIATPYDAVVEGLLLIDLELDLELELDLNLYRIAARAPYVRYC